VEHSKIKEVGGLDPFKPYGPYPPTPESVRVRKQHALEDERRRHFAAMSRINAEHAANLQAIEDHFNAEWKALTFGRAA